VLLSGGHPVVSLGVGKGLQFNMGAVHDCLLVL